MGEVRPNLRWWVEMTEEYLPETESSAGTPTGPRRRLRRIPKAGLIAAVVAILGLGGAGIAFAAGSSSSPSTASGSSSSTTLPAPRAHGPFGPFGRRFRFFGGRVAHGQATIRSGSGYKTIEVQTGTVTAVSSSSITVKSPDGYTSTYAVTPSTVVDSQSAGIGSVAINDDVRLLATEVDGKETAVDIADVSKVKSSRTGFGFNPPASQTAPNSTGGPAGGPAPSSNASRISGNFGPDGGYAE